MSGTSEQHVRVGRSYTRARRFPWVVGKIQGWTIPLGPYTATQLGVLIGGLYLLVKTFPVWSKLGAAALIVIAVPFAATWAVRHARIEGRAPLRALAGYVTLLTEPPCGRIGGRLARDPRPVTLTGGVRLSAPSAPSAPAAQQQPAASPAAAPLELLERQPAASPAFARPRRRPRTAAPLAPMARPAGQKPPSRPHPARQTTPAPATRPAPTALQALLAGPPQE